MSRSALGPVGGDQQFGAVEQRGRIAWLVRQYLVKRGERTVHVALRMQYFGLSQQRFGRLRFDAERAIDFPLCAFKIAPRDQQSGTRQQRLQCVRRGLLGKREGGHRRIRIVHRNLRVAACNED